MCLHMNDFEWRSILSVTSFVSLSTRIHSSFSAKQSILPAKVAQAGRELWAFAKRFLEYAAQTVSVVQPECSAYSSSSPGGQVVPCSF